MRKKKVREPQAQNYYPSRPNQVTHGRIIRGELKKREQKKSRDDSVATAQTLAQGLERRWLVWERRQQGGVALVAISPSVSHTVGQGGGENQPRWVPCHKVTVGNVNGVVVQFTTATEPNGRATAQIGIVVPRRLSRIDSHDVR
jgi:hypothetical protein